MRPASHALCRYLIHYFAWVTLLIWSPASLAAIYYCKDANGRQTYSDAPCGTDAKIITVSPASGSVAIDPSISTRVEYYDVSGQTMAALAASIRQNGPAGWSGVTESRLKYRYKLKPAADGCKLESIEVDADMTVRLPRWIQLYQAPITLRNEWETSIRQLDRHERGHVSITVDAAQRIERAFRNLRNTLNCAEFEKAGRAEADKILQEYSARQVDYDRRTNHGLNQ